MAVHREVFGWRRKAETVAGGALERAVGSAKSIREGLVRWGIPLALYTLMAGALVAPAYLQDEPRILGGGELGGWLWRYWWMKLEILALELKFPHEPFKCFLHIVSLGRYPETGNITDLYAISLPLDLIFGHPGHYNVKVFLIFLTNALAGYAYVRYLTRRMGPALIAGVTLACNVFVFLEVQQSGLRQAILCFIPLFALSFDRLLKERKLWLGVTTGITFAAVAVFYWFYGLFVFIYALMRLGVALHTGGRTLVRETWRPLLLAALVAVFLALPFLWPYISSDYKDPNAPALPEVTWLADFPSVKALEHADLRPGDPRSNLHASLARVLTSSWPIDWAANPLQTRVVPVIMLLGSVVLGLFRWRKTWFWLLLFVMFYTSTWGPYLKYDGEYVHIFGEYLVRLPYWYAFKYVPFMSRLFGPYRMGSMVVFSMTVLLGLNLAAIARRLEKRRWLNFLLGTVVLVLYLGQFHVDPMRYLGIGSNRLLPLHTSSVAVPEWYRSLAKERGRIGIFELPHQQQQNLMSYYQTFHGKKVFGGGDGSWATPGALPPVLRFDRNPSKVTAFLQWLSMPDTLSTNTFAQAMRHVSLMPYVLTEYTQKDFDEVRKRGYRYVVVHELGCFLKEPRWGKELYERITSQLEASLGPPLLEIIEHDRTGDAEDMIPFRNGMPWVPSMYFPRLIPEPRPWPLRMAVFCLEDQCGTETSTTAADTPTAATPVTPSPGPGESLEPADTPTSAPAAPTPPTPTPAPERPASTPMPAPEMSPQQTPTPPQQIPTLEEPVRHAEPPDATPARPTPVPATKELPETAPVRPTGSPYPTPSRPVATPLPTAATPIKTPSPTSPTLEKNSHVQPLSTTPAPAESTTPGPRQEPTPLPQHSGAQPASAPSAPSVEATPSPKAPPRVEPQTPRPTDATAPSSATTRDTPKPPAPPDADRPDPESLEPAPVQDTPGAPSKLVSTPRPEQPDTPTEPAPPATETGDQAGGNAPVSDEHADPISIDASPPP